MKMLITAQRTRFGTAQQLGGAVLGTVFFGDLGSRSFSAAFTHTAPLAAAAFLAAGALSLILPPTAVTDEFVEQAPSAKSA